jgi:pyruvate/2-oxoglutarate dehydrogenase complex dihydrolipoamide acyltransferase (E2) component
VRKVLATIAIATLATIGATAGTVSAQDQVCPNLDTGHLSAGNQTSVTITAPEGKVIVQVCVKAGSAQQGEGPEFTNFDPGVTETTISHSSGKEISHYSVKFADAPPPTTAPATTVPPTTAAPPTAAAPRAPAPAPAAPKAPAAAPAAPAGRPLAVPTPGPAAAVPAAPRGVTG